MGEREAGDGGGDGKDPNFLTELLTRQQSDRSKLVR